MRTSMRNKLGLLALLSNPVALGLTAVSKPQKTIKTDNTKTYHNKYSSKPTKRRLKVKLARKANVQRQIRNKNKH